MAVDLERHGLSRRDRAILDFERQWWRYEARKASTILDRFGMSEPRYYAIVNRLIDQPAAMAHDPFTVKRLRRLREERRARRDGRRAE